MTQRTTIMFNTFNYPQLWHMITARGKNGEYVPLRPMYEIVPIIPISRIHMSPFDGDNDNLEERKR